MALTRLNNSSLSSVTSAGLPAGTITSSNISANMPTGSVLQVLHASTNASVQTASTSFVSSGLSQAITPSSTSNKILCVVSIPSWYLGNYLSWKRCVKWDWYIWNNAPECSRFIRSSHRSNLR